MTRSAWTPIRAAQVAFITIGATVLLAGPSARADEAAAEMEPWAPRPGILLAQTDVDDSYDPFADYSEFDQASDEEEDINFFRNGRLFTLGFAGGYRGWTQNLANIYGGGPTFGLHLSFFFDLRFALQIGFLTGEHPLRIRGPTQTLSGNTSMTDISFNLKYYFNTQNVTRGLADLNPFIIGGFSQIYRTQTVAGNSDFAKDAAFGFNAGAGIELPMLRNKMYFGLMAMFNLITFADENNVIRQSDDTSTGIKPAGDSYQILTTLGVNF